MPRGSGWSPGVGAGPVEFGRSRPAGSCAPGRGAELPAAGRKPFGPLACGVEQAGILGANRKTLRTLREILRTLRLVLRASREVGRIHR